MTAPSALETWALPRLSSLLPLDTDSLKQIIAYTAQLSPDESAAHLRNLLGEESAAVLEFISGFNSRRSGRAATTPASGSATPPSQEARQQRGEQSRSPRSRDTFKKKNTAAGSSLRVLEAQRRKPEGYGDVSGGYLKAAKDEEYGSSSASSRNQSPAVPAGAGSRTPRAPPSAQGPLISDYLPNVRTKRVIKSSSPAPTASHSRSSGSGTPTTTTSNIADLTAAIAALEVSTNPKDRKQRKCNCNASLHPLFTAAPNCLRCGKIICALEGLQPCSFCGTPLLSTAEVRDMVRELRAERGNEKMRVHNESARPGGGSGGGPAPADSSGLEAAKSHRDRLLAFQAQNAQRTRIVDEAADFDVPTVSSTQWMSPAQRALALKKQQRILREMEERAKPEWEQRQMVMSLDVKTGKAVRALQRVEVSSRPEDDVQDDEEQLGESADQHTLGGGSDGAFARNPLLKGAGLSRPVWKAPADKPVQERRSEQKQTWRRVQDDNEDNEQWILDGGLHGHAEVVEDGIPGVPCG